jgi:hypothetical protein
MERGRLSYDGVAWKSRQQPSAAQCMCQQPSSWTKQREVWEAYMLVKLQSAGSRPQLRKYKQFVALRTGPGSWCSLRREQAGTSNHTEHAQAVGGTSEPVRLACAAPCCTCTACPLCAHCNSKACCSTPSNSCLCWRAACCVTG